MHYTGNKKTLFISVIIMVVIVTLFSAAFMLSIFRQNVTNTYLTLQSTANTESELISNIINKNKLQSGKDDKYLSDILTKNDKFLTFSETGDTLLCKKFGEMFKFVWSASSGNISWVQSSTLDDLYTNDIVRALIFGESPVLVGSDYLGRTVLSTYVHITNTDFSLVTKIDLDELWIPFSHIIIEYLFFEFILLALGTILIVLIYTRSLVDKIKKTVNELSQSKQIIKDLQDIEKSLEDIKTDMEEVLEVGSFGFWSYDFKTGISNRSLRHDQMFGYDAVLMDWTFQTFLSHIVIEDRINVKEHFEHALDSALEIDIACRINKTNGELRWIWIRGKKRENSSSLIGIVRDITARKNTEKELNDYRYHLQELVKARTAELEDEKARLYAAYASVKTLKGLLPICSGCKKIRDDRGYWNQVETYIQKHTDTEFSHGLCPDCVSKIYPDMANLDDKKNKQAGKTI